MPTSRQDRQYIDIRLIHKDADTCISILQAQVDDTIIKLEQMQRRREDAEKQTAKLQEETARLKKATLETRWASIFIVPCKKRQSRV